MINWEFWRRRGGELYSVLCCWRAVLVVLLTTVSVYLFDLIEDRNRLQNYLTNNGFVGQGIRNTHTLCSFLLTVGSGSSYCLTLSSGSSYRFEQFEQKFAFRGLLLRMHFNKSLWDTPRVCSCNCSVLVFLLGFIQFAFGFVSAWFWGFFLRFIQFAFGLLIVSVLSICIWVNTYTNVTRHIDWFDFGLCTCARLVISTCLDTWLAGLGPL